MSERVRLQKFLAECGVASRRAGEKLILEGRVTVNGSNELRLGTTIDPECDDVAMNGERLRPAGGVYLALNKPPGFVCTCSDPAGRPKAGDLLPSIKARLFPVGRLDFQSEGIIFFTNDGLFCYRITHPKFGVRRRYSVSVSGRPANAVLARFVEGIRDRGELLKAESVDLTSATRSSSIVDVTLCEGRNREIRRMFQSQGLRVRRLKRVQIGSVELGPLRRGKWRRLTKSEINAFMPNKP